VAGGINIYTYAANNPVGYVDPSGLFGTAVMDMASAGSTPIFRFNIVVIGFRPPSISNVGFFVPAIPSAIANVVGALAALAAIAPQLAELAEKLINQNDSADEPQPQQEAPAIPDGLVGTQDDDAGERGNRHVSGPLAPEHGGTGDAQQDFGKLAGGQWRPVDPTADNGGQIGDLIAPNGIRLRPSAGITGPRIDIPANPATGKPHETLHYPVAIPLWIAF
jgi:hypothetical protein